MSRSIIYLLPLSIIVSIFLLGLTGCYIDLDDDDDFDCIEGRGNFVSEIYDLSEFTRISNSLNANITITTGQSNHRVTVRGQKNVLDELEVRTRGSELILESDRCIERGELEIDISLSEIIAVYNAGSADISGTNVWESTKLTLNLSGSGSIEAIVEANEVDLSIAGSGIIDLTGSSNEGNVSIAGSGDYLAFGMEVHDYDVTISGSGNAEIFVNERLTGTISGSGRIYYRGFPNSVNVNIAGSGDVIDNN